MKALLNLFVKSAANDQKNKGVRKGGDLGLTPPLEHDFLQNFITDAKDINCFRFCLLICPLNANTTE